MLILIFLVNDGPACRGETMFSDGLADARTQISKIHISRMVARLLLAPVN